MRLIDIDDLHVYVMGGRRNGKITVKTLAEEALERIFREAPTVEAIPISWLEDFRDGLDTLSESQLMRAIDLIIEAYRSERKEE